MKTFLALAVLCALPLLTGCAIDVTRHSQHVPMTRVEQPGELLTFPQDVQLTLSGGFFIRKLEQGSTWQAVGDLPQGRVYRSVSKVLMVGSGNAHEAYIVIAQGAVLGVYIPVEGAWITAEHAIPLTNGRKP